MENFFIRILRGSGLNGLASFDKKTNQQNINLIRPLLNFSKLDLKNVVINNVTQQISDIQKNKDSLIFNLSCASNEI